MLVVVVLTSITKAIAVKTLSPSGVPQPVWWRCRALHARLQSRCGVRAATSVRIRAGSFMTLTSGGAVHSLAHVPPDRAGQCAAHARDCAGVGRRDRQPDRPRASRVSAWWTSSMWGWVHRWPTFNIADMAVSCRRAVARMGVVGRGRRTPAPRPSLRTRAVLMSTDARDTRPARTPIARASARVLGVAAHGAVASMCSPRRGRAAARTATHAASRSLAMSFASRSRTIPGAAFGMHIGRAFALVLRACSNRHHFRAAAHHGGVGRGIMAGGCRRADRDRRRAGQPAGPHPISRRRGGLHRYRRG